MQLSELIVQLTEIYEEYGDLPCQFDRMIYPQVDSKTDIVNIYVDTEHDSYLDKPKQRLVFEGI